MSGLAAIVHPDGRPVPVERLDAMLDASAARGRDGRSRWVCGGTALGFLAFHTLPPEDVEPQPLVDPARQLALVFDGRLDNRDDLRQALAGDRGEHPSDARIVLEAIVRWGSGAVDRLLGDFAFVAWDGRARRVLAARDPLGVRPLHYHSSRNLLICATDIAQVLSHPDVPRVPDERAAAEYLTVDVQNTPPTLFRGVHRVPPGHFLIADANETRLQQYWRPEPRGAIRYAADDEYAAHCRELVACSVAARLRSRRPAAVLLSGGIDSSSVFAAGTRVLRHPNGPRPYSLIYPEHAESDEERYIRAVCAHCGPEPALMRPPPVQALAFDAPARRWRDTPPFPADEHARVLHRAMADDGHDVALTGAGADFLFTGSTFVYADLLRRGRVIAAVRRFIQDGGGASMEQQPFGLLQAGIWPLLPVAVKRALGPHVRRFSSARPRPSWLRLPSPPPRTYPDRPRGGSFATEEAVRTLESGMQPLFIQAAGRTAAESGVELRHPFLDRRLVEFALSIPEAQRRRGPYTKFVLREALGDDLPPLVRERRTKGDFAHVVLAALESLGGEHLFGSLRLAAAGWVDGARALDAYREMRHAIPGGHEAYGAYIPELWAIASLEVWLRAAAV